MIGKRAIAVIAGSVLIVTATSALVLAHGFGGPGAEGHEMWLLARAAGLDHSQIAAAFGNDTALATDKANLKSAHEAMISCLFSTTVSSTGCGTQIASFSSALQTTAQERLNVWQNLLKTAPNLSQAASVYSQLQNLHSQKEQILQNVFGSSNGAGGPGSRSGSPVE
jgi:hypothetical protein